MIPELNNLQYSTTLRYLPKTNPYLLRREANVLDIGCGGGGILLHLLKASPNSVFVGLDTNVDALIKLRNTVRGLVSGRNIALIRASAERLPIRDRWVKLLICTHVLEHIEKDDAAFGETVRVLVKKGVYWFAAPKPLLNLSLIQMPLMYLMGKRVGHVRSGYEPADIMHRFRGNGFKISAFFDNSDLIYLLLYTLPCGLFGLIRGIRVHEKPFSTLKRLALKLDSHLPSRFGSAYSIIATKQK